MKKKLPFTPTTIKMNIPKTILMNQKTFHILDINHILRSIKNRENTNQIGQFRKCPTKKKENDTEKLVLLESAIH